MYIICLVLWYQYEFFKRKVADATPTGSDKLGK